MSRLIGAIGSSHAPSIAQAFDSNAGQRDAKWTEVLAGFEPAMQWMDEQRPDTVVLLYNDHLNRFRFDTYPTFALGLCSEYPVADEGRGARALPPVPGDIEFSWHLAEQLLERDFDLTLCQALTLDHGAMSVLPLIARQPWSIRVVPIAVNVILHPLPKPRRCWQLGQAVAQAIAADPAGRRVVVMASGGLSHQLHGPDFGLTNPAWDQRFMDLIETDPEVLARASHEDFAKRGGSESVEMMVWLGMAGAMQASAQRWQRVHRHYCAPALTGYGVLVMESNLEQQLR